MTSETGSNLLALGDGRFVSLTTFRRSGEGVATTVWIAPDGDALLVTTPAGSGKVKRVRNNDRVEVRASGRTGKIPNGASVIAASAELVAEDERATNIFRKKYGLEYRIFMAIERRGKAGQKPRVILRLTPTIS